jgi:DNA-3-methyladenine glycosylase I
VLVALGEDDSLGEPVFVVLLAVVVVDGSPGGLAGADASAPPPHATSRGRAKASGFTHRDHIASLAPSSRAYRPVMERCAWAGTDPLYVAYHDDEWGVPVHDDRLLFEMLTLEGAQAGLSWITVLRKRERYRQVFAGFDPKKVARFDAKKKASLMNDAGIVRNRLKIDSTVSNARAFLDVQSELGSFDDYIWRFVDGKPLVRRPRSLKEVPARTAESDAMSKDLKKRGFRFVGSTICYAFMQACGLVDDHVRGCFRAKTR